MYFHAVRGAITVPDNTEEGILQKTTELLREIFDKNPLDFDNVISIIFSATKDLDAVYPAVAARRMGLNQTCLFCCQEMYVEGSLESCIRILMHVQVPEKIVPQHIYLGKAVNLRPDLSIQNVKGAADEKDNHCD